MFNPTLQTRLQINGTAYTFSPHPVVPALVWGQEGRRGIVFRMVEETRKGQGDAYALKVFRPVHRRHELVEIAAALSLHSELPGMEAAEQMVITRDEYPGVINAYEDLEYAVVMPWIEGATWFDLLNEKRKLTLRESRLLATHMARVLSTLEGNGLAHCDLSSANVIIDPTLTVLHLVDVDDFYGPEMPQPQGLPAGTSGYQHKTSRDAGQWGPYGDRFAGAVMMAEMLGWAHPGVRLRSYGENFFDPTEMQKNNERFRVLRGVLNIHDKRLAQMFEQAWRSQKLSDCPPLAEWYEVLQDLPTEEPVATWQEMESSFYHSKPVRERPQLPAVERLLASLIASAMVAYMLYTFAAILFEVLP